MKRDDVESNATDERSTTHIIVLVGRHGNEFSLFETRLVDLLLQHDIDDRYLRLVFVQRIQHDLAAKCIV